MPNNAIGVQILGDPTSLLRAFRKSEVAAAEFSGRMNALGQVTRGALSQTGGKTGFLFGSTQFVAAAIATAAITKSVQAASDLNEQIAKSNVVFGKSAAVISDWSETTASSIGVARREAIAAAASFGSVFVNTGRTKEQAADFSKTLVNLAGDLASFNNASTDDALNALRSGLAGEIEPLRRFQVFLTEAAVSTEALAETHKKSTKELTQGDKILARYNLILQQTTLQQGDYARTSGSVANQTRTLQANLDDLSTEFGQAFIPTLAVALQGLNDFLEGIHNTIVGLRDLRDRLADSHFADGFNSAVEGATTRLGEWGLAFRDAIPFVNELRDSIVDAGKAADNIKPLKFNSPFESGRTAQSIVTSNGIVDQRELDKATNRFDAFLKGLGLKLSKAQLTGSIAAQLAVLREQEQAILKQESRAGKTFKLEVSLTAVRQQIKNLLDDQTQTALANAQEAVQNILDGFDLKASKAGLTDTLKDDIKVLSDELVAVQRLIAANKDNTSLKQREIELEQNILDLKKQQTEETRAQFREARSQAAALFGTLFKAQDEAKRTLTILGGSKGKQTVVLPGAGGGEDARGLLSDLTTQIKSFKTLQASILELQRKGAPKSLLEAARSGEISADQVNALADANQATLNKIFRNVRLADKLVSKAAKAEITAKDVNLHARTVTVKGAINSHGGGGPREEGFVINGGIHLHGVQNVKQLENELERRRKKRAQQTRGRSGGKR